LTNKFTFQAGKALIRGVGGVCAPKVRYLARERIGHPTGLFYHLPYICSKPTLGQWA